MYVHHEPTENSFARVGVEGKIFPSLESVPRAEFALITTAAGHETKIIERESDFIYYVLEGSGSFTIDGTSEACAAGDLVAIPAGHQFAYDGHLKMLLVSTPPWRAEQEVEAPR